MQLNYKMNIVQDNNRNKRNQVNKEKQHDYKKISQTISWILRHGINELGLKIDDMGRIPLQTLLNLPQIKHFGVDESVIREIVETSDKKRFRLDLVNKIWMIGANQGHSKEIGAAINSAKLMEKITTPLELCVHGTYTKFIKSIKESGLNKMARTHIHMATGFPDDSKVISGARGSSDVFIIIDTEKALNDGIEFYRSANGVILTEGVNGVLDPKYFKDIIYKKK